MPGASTTTALPTLGALDHLNPPTRNAILEAEKLVMHKTSAVPVADTLAYWDHIGLMAIGMINHVGSRSTLENWLTSVMTRYNIEPDALTPGRTRGLGTGGA
ncbi:MAG: hypothetical protein NVS1B14_04120 [Vulcanimicrobiaceae bacterium]